VASLGTYRQFDLGLRWWGLGKKLYRGPKGREQGWVLGEGEASPTQPARGLP